MIVFNEKDQAILARAERFFLEYVAPHAQEIDLSTTALAAVFAEMGNQDLLALRRPEAYGGPYINERAFRTFQEMSARYSGTLSFLMTQHQSAVSLIAKSNNEPLKSLFLPRMGDGRLTIGIGISQLRRRGEPLMRAEPAEGGYIVQGEVPWITGLGFFDGFVLGARLPDNRAIFLLAPMPNDRPNIPASFGTAVHQVSFSEPMRLAAMESAQTVTAQIDGLFIPDGHVLMIKDADWPEANDMINIVLQGHFALGCAQAGLDIVRRAFESKKIDAIQEAAEALQVELDECRSAAHTVPGGMDDTLTQEKLDIRARAIELAVKCAHAAVVASSGAANSLQHPAQRVYREALVFSVSAQTTAIMETTLRRITRR